MYDAHQRRHNEDQPSGAQGPRVEGQGPGGVPRGVHEHEVVEAGAGLGLIKGHGGRAKSALVAECSVRL